MITSKQEVYNDLKEKNVVNPKIATQIAVLESGLKPKYNNLFGFRHGKYLRFTSWRLATEYFKKWEERKYYAHIAKFHSDSSECNYYHFIKAVGYVDGRPFSKANDLYIAKLKRINI